MRFSKLFGKTIRETPSDAQLAAHQLMIRAALMRTTTAGTRTYLPLGVRALHRAQQLVFSAIDGQEIIAGQDDLLSNEIKSYRDIPKVLYQNNSTSIDFFSFEASASTIFFDAIDKVFKLCDLDLTAVEDGENAKAFLLPHAKGDFNFMRCDSCGYSATKDGSKFVIEDCGCDEEISKLEKVGTPNCTTIASLAEFLNIGKCQTLKAVMYMKDDKQFVFVVVRGDLEVSERKIRNLLGDGNLRPATEEEIKAVGAVPGYASPNSLKVANNIQRATPNEVVVLLDKSIHTGRNFAAGANEHGYHFVNVNYPRDFKATMVEDIASPIDGLRCGVCHAGYLREVSGIKVASYEPRRTAAAAATYLDAQGKPQKIVKGYCEIDLEALLVSIIETHHDEQGIIFPESVAPFDVHLIKLGKALETQTSADKLYDDLQAKGKSVLYDDRNESPGVMFTDADLIGLPLRITVSDKSLKAGGVEVKRRSSDAKEIVPLEMIK